MKQGYQRQFSNVLLAISSWFYSQVVAACSSKYFLTKLTAQNGVSRAFNLNKELGPVVRTPFSANPGLNFNPGYFFFLSKALSRISFSTVLKYPIIKLQAKSIKLNLPFTLSYPSSNFALTLGYLNPASNNPAPSVKQKKRKRCNGLQYKKMHCNIYVFITICDQKINIHLRIKKACFSKRL